MLINKYLLALLLAAPGLALAQTKTNFEINGTLKNVDVAMVYLVHSQGNDNITDSAKVINSRYALKGFTEVGQRCIIMSYNMKRTATIKPDGLALIFLAPGVMNLTHDGAFNKINVSGSSSYSEWQSLITAVKPYEEKINLLNKKANDQQLKGDTIAAKDIYAQKFSVEQELGDKVYGAFIRQHPKSPVAFFALQQYAGNEHNIDGQKLMPYFNLLPKNIQESEPGQLLNKRLADAITFNTKGVIGSQAPGFTLLDTAGREVTLSDYKGKYVLLDFWASWCSPCRADNPHLVAAFEEYHQKGFTILSVSLDTRIRKNAWLAAIKHDHLSPWTHVADLDNTTNKAIGIYGISGIPQNYLIAPDGKILARSLRGGDLEKKLKEIFHN